MKLFEYEKLTLKDKKNFFKTNYRGTFKYYNNDYNGMSLKELYKLTYEQSILNSNQLEKTNNGLLAKNIRDFGEFSLEKKYVEEHEYFGDSLSPFSQAYIHDFVGPFYFEASMIFNNLQINNSNSYVIYNSADQMMMHYKAVLFGDYQISRKILVEVNQKRIANLGRDIINFSDKIWDDHKTRIVHYVNKYKFMTSSFLRDHLLSTKGKILVKATQDDCIWGVGLSKDDPKLKEYENWKGTNLLGELLTTLRISIDQDKIDFILKI